MNVNVEVLFQVLYAVAVHGAVGAALGKWCGRTGAGFAAGLLLGPIGWALILLGPDFSTKKRQAADEQKQEVLRCGNGNPERAVVRGMETPATREGGAKKRLPLIGAMQRVRVARGTEDLGERTLAEVQRDLAAGVLTGADFYLDPTCGEWLELSGHPSLAEGAAA